MRRKSQLAIEYLYRTRERLPKTSIFWVHASNAARFEQSYQQIADNVKIPGWRDPKANILKLVRDWLQNETRGKWVLILDNIDNADFLFRTTSTFQAGKRGGIDFMNSQPLAAYLPQSENGSILLTTRTRSAALRLVEETDIILIGPMDVVDAISLFRNKLQISDDSKDVSELVEALEFMPLAIVQAAAYILQTAPRCSVQKYLEILREGDSNKARLLNYGAYSRRDAEAENAIITTWQISFDNIQQTRSSAANLLSLMSFFDRQGIPEALIRKRTKMTKVCDRNWSNDKDGKEEDASDSSNYKEFEGQFEGDIQTLRDHSLISVSVDRATFEMHALVQLAMRKWLEGHGQLESWKQQYIENISEEFPAGEYENWEKCLLLLPHAKAAIAQQPEGEDSRRQWATLLYNVAWYAWRRGILADTEEISMKSMKARKNLLGLEHPETLSSMAMVGLVYKLNGRWGEAEELEIQVMDTRKRVLGQEHPDTLTSMANLASTYRNQGRWKEAEELEVQVIEASKRVLGFEHPSTLTSMANLASTFLHQGRLKEAEELEVQVIEASKRVLGFEHPSTLTSMANLASTYRNQGRWKEAEELEVQVMETSLRVLGAEHPSALASMANLASTYKSQGRWKEAEELDMQVVATRKRVLGAEHPSTLSSMANLASTFRNQGQWKEAEELEVQVMETRKRVLGAEHPSTLASMNNLAFTWKGHGRDREALTLMEECVMIRNRILGPNHPYTLSSRTALIGWQTEVLEIGASANQDRDVK